MKVRINLAEKGMKAINGLLQLGKHLYQSPVENKLLHLLYLRASQINGCAMCLDIHSKDLLAEGEDPQRLFLIDAWKDAPIYTGKEKAALAYTEELTLLERNEVSDEVFNALKPHFTEEEIIDLTVAIITINSFNRINIAFGAEVGSYKVGQFRQ